MASDFKFIKEVWLISGGEANKMMMMPPISIYNKNVVYVYVYLCVCVFQVICVEVSCLLLLATPTATPLFANWHKPAMNQLFFGSSPTFFYNIFRNL